MRRADRGPLASRRTGMLLAFLAVATVGPRVAEAGCSSHHVTATSAMPGLSTRLELLEDAGVLPSPGGEAPRQRPAPCTGPMCSKAPALPAPTTSSHATAGVNQWAISHVPTPPAGPNWSARSIADPRPLPEDRPASIFHPPRSIALG